MGMYDTLSLNINKLPISDDDKKKLGANPVFQTKDFDCYFSKVTLKDTMIDIEEYENTTNRSIKDFHGFVNFYTSVKHEDGSKEWYEFNAKYTDGKLVEIVRVIDN